MTTKERTDIYQRITDQIAEAIERGAGTYKMPWHTSGEFGFSPINAQSGRPYRGINVLVLWSEAEKRGFSSGLWATYKQWSDLGAQVRRGEKATAVVFWKFSQVQTKAEDSEEESEKSIPFAREYSVFNSDQVTGFKSDEAKPVLSESERVEGAEQFFSSLGAEIRTGGNRAFYSSDADLIWVPNFSAFRNGTAYYSVLAHETTHWTGAPHRLNRDMSHRFGSEAYAVEELVAELGAAFVCADLGLTHEPRTDHAAYIASWLKALRNDKRAIFTASSKAQAAVDWMHSQQGEGRAAA